MFVRCVCTLVLSVGEFVSLCGCCLLKFVVVALSLYCVCCAFDVFDLLVVCVRLCCVAFAAAVVLPHCVLRIVCFVFACSANGLSCFVCGCASLRCVVF